MSSRPRRRTTKAGLDDSPPSEKRVAFGRNLREARLKQEMLQRELGVLTEMQETHISRIEAGKINLTFLTIERLAKALGVSITQLLGGKNGDV